MSDAMNRQTFKNAEVIFQEGDTGARAYLVENGSVEIRKNVDGKEVVLGRVDKGGIFGEMALIDDAPRMASAVANGDSTLLVISEQTFKAKMESSDPFIRALLRIFAQNIRATARAKREGGSGPMTGDAAAANLRDDVSWMLDC